MLPVIAITTLLSWLLSYTRGHWLAFDIPNDRALLIEPYAGRL